MNTSRLMQAYVSNITLLEKENMYSYCKNNTFEDIAMEEVSTLL
jgi:hypothetical protein